MFIPDFRVQGFKVTKEGPLINQSRKDFKR